MSSLERLGQNNGPVKPKVSKVRDHELPEGLRKVRYRSQTICKAPLCKLFDLLGTKLTHIFVPVLLVHLTNNSQQEFIQYPKMLGNIAITPTSKTAPIRKKLSLYVQRFSYFFSREFFLRRFFEKVMKTASCDTRRITSKARPTSLQESESDSAESGRKPDSLEFAIDNLYKLYVQHMSECGNYAKVGLPESLQEYCYDDEHLTELNVDNSERFLFWLEVMKMPEPMSATASVDNQSAGEERSGDSSIELRGREHVDSHWKATCTITESSLYNTYIYVQTSQDKELDTLQNGGECDCNVVNSEEGADEDAILPEVDLCPATNEIPIYVDDSTQIATHLATVDIDANELPQSYSNISECDECIRVSSTNEKVCNHHVSPESKACHVENDNESSGSGSDDNGSGVSNEDDAAYEVLQSLHCTCPICFEVCDDVEVLPHYNPIGDVSSHKMCGKCKGTTSHSCCGLNNEKLPNLCANL